MTQTYEAIYDGIIFRPEEPVKLKPNTRVQIIVEVEEESTKTVADVAGHLFGVIDVEATVQTASAWDDWARSHSENDVIVDDRREVIYQDEETAEDIQADTNILLRTNRAT